MAYRGGGTGPNDPRLKRKRNRGKGVKTRDGKRLFPVPFGSYDPSLSAQLEASRRGLGDMRQDTRTANRWARTDLSQRLGDIGRGWQRGKQDMVRGFRRSTQKLNIQRADLQRDAGRAREDFGTRLADIGRQFTQLAGSQQEAQNAAGTLGGGTAAAAAAKRAENQRLAEQPIRTAQARMEQDLATNLNRIQVSENQLGQDFRRGFNRGLADTRRDARLSRRDFGRGQFSRTRKLRRGVREQRAGEVDLTAQMIDSARQRNPGVFSKYGRRKNRNRGF